MSYGYQQPMMSQMMPPMMMPPMMMPPMYQHESDFPWGWVIFFVILAIGAYVVYAIVTGIGSMFCNIPVLGPALCGIPSINGILNGAVGGVVDVSKTISDNTIGQVSSF